MVDHHHGDHHHGPAKGLGRWLFTTNHKDIGTMYLWFSFCMFILGGTFAMIIRAELFQPGIIDAVVEMVADMFAPPLAFGDHQGH